MKVEIGAVRSTKPKQGPCARRNDGTQLRITAPSCLITATTTRKMFSCSYLFRLGTLLLGWILSPLLAMWQRQKRCKMCYQMIAARWTCDWIQLCAERLLGHKCSFPLSPVSSSELHKEVLDLSFSLTTCLFSQYIPTEQHCGRPLSGGKNVTKWCGFVFWEKERYWNCWHFLLSLLYWMPLSYLIL